MTKSLLLLVVIAGAEISYVGGKFAAERTSLPRLRDVPPPPITKPELQPGVMESQRTPRPGLFALFQADALCGVDVAFLSPYGPPEREIHPCGRVMYKWRISRLSVNGESAWGAIADYNNGKPPGTYSPWVLSSDAMFLYVIMVCPP